ncbi:MAG: HTTM domain-containing protein [Chitinophagales bacterium]
MKTAFYQKINKGIDTFFFNAAPSNSLYIFRIVVAIFCIVHIGVIAEDLLDLYGRNGYVRAELVEAVLSAQMPRINWVSDWMMGFGFSEQACIYLLFSLYLIALFGLLVGFCTRISAMGACFIHLLFVGSGQLFAYGVDFFTSTCLFYCVFMPVGKGFSIDSLLFKRTKINHALNAFSVRVLQLHLCLVYFFGGFCKMLGTQWWDGEAMWRIFMQNGFEVSWLAQMPWLAAILSCSVLVLETTYPFFIYYSKTRSFWLISIVLMHIGIGFTLNLWFFASIMIIINVSAFGSYLLQDMPQFWKSKERYSTHIYSLNFKNS